MVNREEERRIQQILADSIKVLCRSIITFKESLQIDGLVGIRVDNRDVLLVKIENAVNVGVEVMNVAASQAPTPAPMPMNTPPTVAPALTMQIGPELVASLQKQEPAGSSTPTADAMNASSASHIAANLAASNPSPMPHSAEQDHSTAMVHRGVQDHATPLVQVSVVDRKRGACLPEDAPGLVKRKTPTCDVENVSTAAAQGSSHNDGSRPVWTQYSKVETDNPPGACTTASPSATLTSDLAVTDVIPKSGGAKSKEALDPDLAKREALEKKLMDWIKSQWSRNISVTQDEIRKKAVEFHREEQVATVQPQAAITQHQAGIVPVPLNPLLMRYTPTHQEQVIAPSDLTGSPVLPGRELQLLQSLIRVSEVTVQPSAVTHGMLQTPDSGSVFSLPASRPQHPQGVGVQHVQPIGHVQPIVQPMLGRIQPVLGPVHAVEPTLRAESQPESHAPRVVFSTSPAQPNKQSPRRSGSGGGKKT